jgi:hypothetical protein
MSMPLVSVVVAISGPDVHLQPVVEGIGKALTEAGYGCEFVFVLDGPYWRVEQELRRLESDWPLHIVQLQGGGLGESIACRRASPRRNGELHPQRAAVPAARTERLTKVVARRSRPAPTASPPGGTRASIRG